MASAEEEGRCLSITWEIENFGLFLAVQEGKRLYSRVWKVELTGGSAWWRLGVSYVRHYHSDSCIYFGLQDVKENCSIDRCEMSLITSFGEVLPREDNCFFMDRDAILGLPNDTLTFRCKIREERLGNREFHICSVLQSVNYLWSIKEYDSSRKYYACIELDHFTLYGFLNERSERGTHTVKFEQLPCAESCIYFVDYHFFITDGRLCVINTTCIFPNVKLKFDIKILSENNTSINLKLESIVTFHKDCQNELKVHSQPEIVKQENSSNAVSGSSGALNDDLLLLYKENALSDATLNTEGKSFSAHRSILAARSPVFRAMFEKDEMNEGRSGVVDIDDVDSETVDRMLVFLYGDLLEGVQWEEASALYYAADKYAILPLKQKCTHILRTGLSVDNACNALVLADRHTDDHLMKCIVDFIREKEEVISSDNWDNLQNRNPLLAAKILREIFMKNKKK